MAHHAISLFSGAGGLDCGLSAAGFKSVVSLDMDSVCAESLSANRCGEVLSGDVARFSAADLLSAAGKRCGEIDVLTAGPPCQPFSKSANWRHGAPRGLQDPRAETLKHMLRLIEGMLPRVVLFENVPGFGGTGPRAGLDFLSAKIARINKRHGTGYRLNSFLVDAANYGVPQHRKRLIVVLDREGRSFEMPPPSHGLSRPFVTAWDAIGDLDRRKADPELSVRGRWADLLPSIPEGENYLWHTDRGGGLPLFGYRTRYWSFLLKLAKARPAWTLPASPSQNTGPFHWRNRLLSVEEMARLQSFPDSWKFAGTRVQQVKQIGNAVPPLLAEVIGLEIRKQLLASRPSQRPPKLLGTSTRRLPPPEPAQPVERAYLALIGSHCAHPGHGKGPGAKRRILEAQADAGEQSY